jgi:acyl dehydratase
VVGNFLSRWFDEISIGETFVSRGRTVTEADIVAFAALSGDWFVLHTDAHYATGTRFGQRIAHGLLIYVMSTGLAVPPDAPAIIANYGCDRLRFTSPTFIGDTIRVRSKVLAKTIKRDGRDGVLRLGWNVANQNDVPVLVSDMNILMAFAPPREASAREDPAYKNPARGGPA